MTKNVITVTPEEDVSAVAKILQKHKIHGVPVIKGKKLIGIITETDFFIKGEMEIHLPSYVDFLNKTGLVKNNEKESIPAELKEILKVKAGDIMTIDCITINKNADISELITLLKKKDLHTVPVVDGDTLEGVVTVADIIKLI